MNFRGAENEILLASSVKRPEHTRDVLENAGKKLKIGEAWMYDGMSLLRASQPKK